MAVCDLLVRLFKPTLVEAGSDVIHVFTFRSLQEGGAMEFDGNVLRSGVFECVDRHRDAPEDGDRAGGHVRHGALRGR